MVADHLALLLLSIETAPWNVWFFTRLSEPLFALLFGYFLAARGAASSTGPPRSPSPRSP